MSDELKKPRKPYTNYKKLYNNLLTYSNYRESSKKIEYVHDPADAFALEISREMWDEMKAKNDALAAENARIAKIIAAAEWWGTDDYDDACPICHRRKEVGHSPTCPFNTPD